MPLSSVVEKQHVPKMYCTLEENNSEVAWCSAVIQTLPAAGLAPFSHSVGRIAQAQSTILGDKVWGYCCHA